MVSRNTSVFVIIAIIVVIIAAIVVPAFIRDNNTCHVTFVVDRGSEYQSLEVESGSTIPEPAVPNMSNSETFYYLAGWVDQDGNSWDFDTPVSDDITLYADKRELCDTYYLGFELNLNFDLRDGWTHYISWGDGSVSTYPDDSIQPDNLYTESGTFTITIQSTNSLGESYISYHTWEPLCDSSGSVVPAADSRFSLKVDREISDKDGTVLGNGLIHVYGHDISSASIYGMEYDQSVIDRMNEIRDLSHARVNSEGIWTYTHSEGGHPNISPGNYEVYRIVYDDSSYDLISENGLVIAIHVGGDVNLNFDWASGDWGVWTKP